MYLLLFCVFVGYVYYKIDVVAFVCDLYYRYSIMNKDITALGENRLVILNVSVYKKHSTVPIKDRDFFYYSIWLSYIFGIIDINHHKPKKIDWDYTDFVLIEYQYNGKNYNLVLTKDFDNSMRITKDKEKPLYATLAFNAKLYSHDNRVIDVSSDILKYTGPFHDFYDFMGLGENRDLRYVLNNYQLDEYIQLEISTYLKTHTIDLEETTKIEFG